MRGRLRVRRRWSETFPSAYAPALPPESMPPIPPALLATPMTAPMRPAGAGRPVCTTPNDVGVHRAATPNPTTPHPRRNP